MIQDDYEIVKYIQHDHDLNNISNRLQSIYTEQASVQHKQ
jgi:hypothetical protein